MAKRHSIRQSVYSFAAAKGLRAARAAFVALMSAVKETTSRANQKDFQPDLEKRYGVEFVSNVKEVWSPACGWLNRKDVIAAHIFPLQFGQLTMDYVCGKEAAGEINNAQNGLFLPGEVEARFDKYQVIIVPCEQQSYPPEYKWLVLNKNIYAKIQSNGITFRELHGRKLMFQNDFRPRARYLYFHYLEAMRHHSKTSQRSGHLPTDHPEVTYPELTKAWGSSGSYMRDNLLFAFIEHMDHDLGDDDKANQRAFVSWNLG